MDSGSLAAGRKEIFQESMMTENDRMISVDEAIRIILSEVKPTPEESAPILDSVGRVLSRDIVSDVNIPPTDNSAMDGYALKHESTRSATGNSPAELVVCGEIRAGSVYSGPDVAEGFAVRIMTGAPIPDGADAVVPVEDTLEAQGKVRVLCEFQSGENIRRAGEDIAAGMTVLSAGHRIRPADIGLLASLNRIEAPVRRRPVVAIIATGDELVDPGEEIGPGQIRNSNAYALYAEILKYGAIPRYLGIARDTMQDTFEKFKQAFEADIVITTGGVSMGKYDFVKDVMRDIGVGISVRKILMKPGKPLVFGAKDGKLCFGLPGNPVSSLVSFLQFVRPAILKSMGARSIDKPVVNAVLLEDIRKKPERRHFIRGFFSIRNGELVVSTTGPQGSGILMSMSQANCLIILKEGVSLLRAGDRVPVQLINHEEI